MTLIKVELAHQHGLRVLGVGATIGGCPIVQTIKPELHELSHPDVPADYGFHANVEVPDGWDEATIEAWARNLLNTGLLHDDGELWRYGKVVHQLGWRDLTPLLTAHTTNSGPVVGNRLSFEPADVEPYWVKGDPLAGIGVTPATQARGRYGEGVKVALIDTGLDGNHPDFAQMRAEGRLLGTLTDTGEHGTHCGGIIVMVAPGIILRVWTGLPGGSGSEALIARCIDEAVDWGAQVISMSLGGAGTSAVINQSVIRAKLRNVICVSAAGNGSSQGPVGSPANASTLCITAYDRSDPPRNTPWSDGFFPGDERLPRVARPGLEIISCKPGGGYQPMSGTSMACPHEAGCSALLLGSGMTPQQAGQYTASHMGGAPGGLLSKLLEDFGQGTAPPVDPPVEPPPAPDLMGDIRQSVSELDQCIALQDDARYIQRAANPDFAYTEFGEASRVNAIARNRLIALLPKVPVEPPPPEPVLMVGGIFGTYAGHGFAQDAYGGFTPEQIAWGPHHGIPLYAPDDGTIEVFQFGTPLNLVREMGQVYEADYHALFDQWTCRFSEAQTMFVAVWRPAAGGYVVGGQTAAWLHYGHVHPDIKAGVVRKGERFAWSWDSGIRFDTVNPVARASHTHCCAGRGVLSPNGDMDGRLAIIAQHWNPLTDIRTVPGPEDYRIPNGHCAGRRYADFVAAGKPVPPLPVSLPAAA